jgi:Ca2+-binding RTX toxin-like protein
MNISGFLDQIKDIERYVTNEAGSANLPGKENGPQDAYRHLLLSAEFTRVFGEFGAKFLLNLHEVENLILDGQPFDNSSMDWNNNTQGSEIGENAQSWDDIVTGARSKMDQSVNGAGASDPNGPVTWMNPQEWSDANSTNTTPYSERNWPTNPSLPAGPVWPSTPYTLPPNLVSPPTIGNYQQQQWLTLQDIINFGINLENWINGIEQSVANLFSAARTYVPPRGDPLALDLDRDGIETIGANGTVLFDHDGDGVKTGTGWVAADDGLLVLDRNGNGQIDTGAELFGVDTVLANGQKASDGFAALRDLDANADSVFDAADAQFGNVRVWRDLNQNGTSQAGELFTLQSLGIAAINLNATAETVDLGNGNVQTATASYVLTNGTTGETTGVGLGETAANLELALNPFYRQFTDAITLTEQARLLPEMQGSGRVRDLREAVSLSPELAASLSAYAQQTTRAGQMAQMGGLLSTWGATSGMATSVEQASAQGYRLLYLNPGELIHEYESLLPYWDADENGLAGLTAEQRQTLTQIKTQQAEIAQRIGTLERFNGMSFVTVDANGVTTGQGWRLDAENTPGADGVRRVYVSLMNGQDTLLDASYQSLKESVYSGMALQTRLKPYLDAVALQVDTSGLHLDFAGITAALGSLRQTDAANALIDMIELHKLTGPALYSLGWNELSTLRTWIEAAANDAGLQNMLTELGVKRTPDDLWGTLWGTEGADLILGQAGDEYLLGNGGNDLLSGDAGADNLDGGIGNDILDGGTGNDYLVGGAGNDVYLYGRGDGQDTIYDYGLANGDIQDTIRLKTDINPADVTLSRDVSNLYLIINGTGDSLTISNWFDSTNYRVERIGFADGTMWDAALLANAPYLGTDGADYLYGTSDNETFIGGTGDDTLHGNGGNDVLNGGTGDDALDGGIGNDTYVFGRGYGRDMISDYDTTAGNSDTILLNSDVVPGDAVLWRDTSHLYLSINGTGDMIMVQSWFDDPAYQVEKIQFADGTVWDTSTMRAATFRGTDAADSITGTIGNDFIEGLGGDDSLYGDIGNDTLDGGAGVDSMAGSLGNDIYVVDDAGDVVTENLDEGIDTVQSFITYTLGDNLENLTLTGTAAVNGTGNTLNNVLMGNSGINSLTGAAGNDTLDGAAGADTLTGGVSNDTYILGRGYSIDTVVEADATVGNTDVAQFLTTIANDQLWFQHIGNNLEVSVIGAADKLVVKDWYLGTANHVEQFKTTDGAKTLIDSNVQNLVNAMAAFAPPAAGQTTLPANYQASLASVIAANWQ